MKRVIYRSKISEAFLKLRVTLRPLFELLPIAFLYPRLPRKGAGLVECFAQRSFALPLGKDFEFLLDFGGRFPLVQDLLDFGVGLFVVELDHFLFVFLRLPHYPAGTVRLGEPSLGLVIDGSARLDLLLSFGVDLLLDVLRHFRVFLHVLVVLEVVVFSGGGFGLGDVFLGVVGIFSVVVRLLIRSVPDLPIVFLVGIGDLLAAAAVDGRIFAFDRFDPGSDGLLGRGSGTLLIFISSILFSIFMRFSDSVGRYFSFSHSIKLRWLQVSI